MLFELILSLIALAGIMLASKVARWNERRRWVRAAKSLSHEIWIEGQGYWVFVKRPGDEAKLDQFLQEAADIIMGVPEKIQAIDTAGKPS